MVLLVTAAPLLILFQNFTYANVPTSTASKLFVPKNFAPLSGFVEKLTTSKENLSLTVPTKVLSFIVAGKYANWIAYQNNTGVVALIAPGTVDMVTGLVTLNTSNPGRYVFVSEPFTNDYPIVTHWKQSLNFGRGGFQAGASDAIGTLDYSPELDIVGESSDLFDNDPLSPLTFNIKKYALFSADPLEPQATVPSIDRYVGENYSVDRITDRLAVFQSLKTLETTGFPLIHRNHPWAFDSTLSTQKHVMQNIPVLQVVHAIVIEAEAGKSSLATYILPPNWVSRPLKPYPVLFNGLYDIHQNFSWGYGQDFIQIISNLVSSGVGPTVGILWNGGGAYGPQTMQMSSYLNVAYLFNLAQYYAGIDMQKIVTAGISRGAQTAINVAANPIFNNYKVAYALAWSPPSIMGEHVSAWVSTNYPGDFINQAWTTGYKYAYQSTFRDPNFGLDGRALFLKNVTGSVDANFADALSPVGDWVLDALKSKGTSVYVSAGTNDAFIPFNNQLRLYNRLKEKGIPTEFDIGYRYGHSYFVDKNQLITGAMKEVFAGTLKPFAGIKNFRRPAAGVGPAESFVPDKVFFAEIPKQVYLGQKLRLDTAGSPGLAYSIFFYKIDDALWNTQRQIRTIGEYTTLQSNIFSSSDAIQSLPFDVEVPFTMLTGKYICLAAISVDLGKNWSLVDMFKNSDPSNGGLTVFEVLAIEQTSPASVLGPSLMFNGTATGVSLY